MQQLRSISVHLIEFANGAAPTFVSHFVKLKNLPEESFLSDLGEGEVNNLGSGVGAVAMEMLSSTNLVSP